MKFKAAFLLLTYEICFFKQLSLAQTQCNNGDVRLEGGRSEAEGRVEVCVKEKWGAVTAVTGNEWEKNDAKVVCRQLGYSKDNATAFTINSFTQSNQKKCKGSEEKLVHCRKYESVDIRSGENVAVHCQPRTYILQNVTAVESSTSVTISWRPPDPPHNNTLFYYHVVCSAFVNVSNATYGYQVETQTQTFSATLSNLLPSTAYRCCVSISANSNACLSIKTGDSAGNSAITSNCNAVGGGLGTLVVILVILLIGIIVYLKFWHKTKVTENRRCSTSTGNLYSKEVILHNPTYDAHYMEIAPENPNSSQYSALGPDYELIESRNTAEGNEYSHLRH